MGPTTTKLVWFCSHNSIFITRNSKNWVWVMKIEHKFLLFLNHELWVMWHSCKIWQTCGTQLNVKSTSKIRCQHSLSSFLFFFFSFFSFLSFFFQFVRFSLLFYVFFLSSFLISFFLSPSPKFLCSQLFLFPFLDFSLFLSTPIWVVICVYGFYIFIYLFI